MLTTVRHQWRNVNKEERDSWRKRNIKLHLVCHFQKGDLNWLNSDQQSSDLNLKRVCYKWYSYSKWCSTSVCLWWYPSLQMQHIKLPFMCFYVCTSSKLASISTHPKHKLKAYVLSMFLFVQLINWQNHCIQRCLFIN